MNPEFFSELLKLGPVGLVVSALLFAVIRLYSKNEELQEKRIAEAREGIKAIEQNTNTLDTLAEVLKERGRS